MRYLKIFAFNLIFIVLIIFAANFFIFYKEVKHDINYHINGFKKMAAFYYKFLSRDISEKNTYEAIIQDKNHWYRPIENKTSKELPIILFGCSYTYGTNLKDNETFSYQLARLTNRPVYNRAYGGWGVQHMLYQLTSSEELYNMVQKFSKPPEYVIYTFIRSHYYRLKTPVSLFFAPSYLVFYKPPKDGKLELKKGNFINQKMILHHFFMNKFVYTTFSKYPFFQEYFDDLLLNYFIEAKKALNSRWPKTKFVIFFYEEPFSRYLVESLKENNFLIISKKDIGINPEDKKYHFRNDPHPNALFWHSAIPPILQKLQDYKSNNLFIL